MLSGYLAALSLAMLLVVFAVAAAVIAVVGYKIAAVADKLADRTGLGEALFGALLLGAATSLPGIVTSVVTAFNGHASLSISNAVGGIAAQTAFLAIADMAYRKANLEHAAASMENLIQGALLLCLLSLPLLASVSPNFTLFAIHPVSFMILLGYVGGLHLSRKVRDNPLWKPEQTPETQQDQPEADDASGPSTATLWWWFAIYALLLAVAGYLVAQSGVAISQRTGLSEGVVGTLFTAVATSLPELVTAVAAVRRGALALAVGDIVGGNAFDVLFLTCADIAYREGSIYHAIAADQVFVITLSQLLTGILLLGMLRREKRGIAGIGFESVLILLFYAGGVALLAYGIES